MIKVAQSHFSLKIEVAIILSLCLNPVFTYNNKKLWYLLSNKV